MALKSPDMASCKEKVKCLGGVNNGLAYDPSDPCESGLVFDPLACECNTVLPDGFGYWRWIGGATNGSLVGSRTIGGAATFWLSNGYAVNNGVARQTIPGWWTVEIPTIVAGTPDQNNQGNPDNPNVPLNAGGSLTKINNCNGGGNSLAYVYLSEFLDGVYSYTYSFAYSLSYIQLEADFFWCSPSVSLGTTASYSGTWQFSPNADPNNITHEYSAPPTLP